MDWIAKSRAKHGDKYDYSLGVYVNALTKVEIVCPEHGSFWQTPASHYSTGCGCPSCSGRPKVDTDVFIKRLHEVHGDRYDYSKVVYVTNKTPVTIICPDHGKFEKTPVSLIQKKRGCPKCTKGYYAKKTTEEWIVESRVIHGNRYDYSKSHYVGAASKIVIICPEHGEFEQTAREHSGGANCSECVGGVKKSFEYYLDEFRTVHGNAYEYDEASFVNSKTPMRMKCSTHGWFNQAPGPHLSGRGCPKCAPNASKDNEFYIEQFRQAHGDTYAYHERADRQWNIECSTHGTFVQDIAAHKNGSGCPKCIQEQRKLDIEELQTRIDAVHGDTYEYDWTTYIGANIPMRVICKDHGEFWQRMQGHIRGPHRCPTCAGKNSLAEQAVYEFVESLVSGWCRSDRNIAKPFELDMVHEELNIAIEYNGIRWHSDSVGGKDRHYHLNKLDSCEEKGCQLITIFEDEWLDRPDVVKDRLTHILGKSPKGAAARKLAIRDIDWGTARDFMDNRHLQGAGSPCKIRYGAYDGTTLVAVMTFGKTRVALGSKKRDNFELLRFCTDGNSHAGLATRMFTRFVKDHNPNGVVSYADRRWSRGGVYSQMGFQFRGVSKPGYWYFKLSTANRVHRYAFRKDQLISKYGADPSKTEWEIMQEMGYDRIWDCGNLKYQWNAE